MVELGARLAAVWDEAHALAAPVVRRALAGDQALVLEASEDAAEVAGVEVERAAQVGDVDLAVAEVVQDAGVGERVLGLEKALAKDADAAGVETVEGAHGVRVGGHVVKINEIVAGRELGLLLGGSGR